MTPSFKTDVLSALPATTSLQDTDLIPVGTGTGATLKKMTSVRLRCLPEIRYNPTALCPALQSEVLQKGSTSEPDRLP